MALHGLGYASGSASRAAGNLVGAAAPIEQVPRCGFRKSFNRRLGQGRQRDQTEDAEGKWRMGRALIEIHSGYTVRPSDYL